MTGSDDESELIEPTEEAHSATPDPVPPEGPFTVQFADGPPQELDDHALQVRQDWNFGNTDRWFQQFRGGLYGMYARQGGLCSKYAGVHAWSYEPKHPAGTDTPIGELFFNADSALECFVYALNALGHGVGGTEFRNTMSEAELRRVSPLDPKDGRVAGWGELFPRFTATLAEGWEEWVVPVMDQHDVAKHRQSIHHGGQMRNDPPEGFWEAVGDPEDSRRFFYTPYAEVILIPDPKRPRAKDETIPREDLIKLEELIPGFAAFIDELVSNALEDVIENVPLNPKPGDAE